MKFFVLAALCVLLGCVAAIAIFKLNTGEVPKECCGLQSDQGGIPNFTSAAKLRQALEDGNFGEFQVSEIYVGGSNEFSIRFLGAATITGEIFYDDELLGEPLAMFHVEELGDSVWDALDEITRISGGELEPPSTLVVSNNEEVISRGIPGGTYVEVLISGFFVSTFLRESVRVTDLFAG